MLDKEVRAAIEEFKTKHGSGVRLSTLLRDFPAFEPEYKPRGKAAADPVASETASKTRSTEALYQALLKAIVDESLNLTDEDGTVDMGAISESHGGTYFKNSKLPDFVVELDNDFFKFCQSLPARVGGSKNPPAKKPGERSPNSQRLYEALKELEKANGASAKKFLEVYRELQVPMKLPKLD